MSATRFIVTGFPRTGSTLLCSCLGQNPKVRLHYELFHERVEERASVNGIKWDGQVDPLDVLELAFGDATKQEDFGASGFKLFFGHARRGAESVIWRRIASDPQVKLIFLRRPWLEILASLECARRSGVWAVPASASAPDVPPFKLDFGWAKDTLDAFWRDQVRVKGLLRQHEWLQINYAHIATCLQPTLRKVENFLNVSTNPDAIPRFVQQRCRVLEEQVLNLKPIRDGLATEPYFDELFSR